MAVSNLAGPITLGAPIKNNYCSTVQLTARWTTTPSGLAQGATAYQDNFRGVAVLPWTRVMQLAPAASSATNIGTSQSINAGASAVLTAGTGVTKTTNGTTTVYRLDTPRCVGITSAGDDSANTWTISGFDEYGVAMTAAFAGGATALAASSKAFLDVSSIVSTTTSAAAVSIGTTNIFGLALYAQTAADVLVFFDGTLQNTPGNFTAGVTTSPATSATGDVRGTYSMTGTNGSKILSISQCNLNLSAGATRASGQTEIPPTTVWGVAQA